MSAATPASIIEKLNMAANEALSSANIQAGLKKLGADAIGGSVRNVAAFMAANAKTSVEMVAAAGIQPE